MVILANAKGQDICSVNFQKIDVDLNETRNFELTIPAASWNQTIAADLSIQLGASLQYGARIYIPDTEYGGIIGTKKVDTGQNTITIGGMCWRGILSYKILDPPAGQDYLTVTGDLNTVLAQLISQCNLSSLMQVSSEPTGVTVSGYQFDRYCTLLDGINKMLKSQNYKLSIKYQENGEGNTGYVLLAAVPVVDYSQHITLSQDNRLDFTFSETQNGVNHLICLGAGELQDRLVVDLYAQPDGSISQSQYYTGLEEIESVYDNNSISDEAEMIEQATSTFQGLMNAQTFSMDVETLGIEIELGDIIGGKDYITGMSLAQPVFNKIYREEAGKISKEYKVEGDT